MIDTDKEPQAVSVVQSDGEDRLSIVAISDLTGIDAKVIRKYLYRGIIGSTKKSDVLAWMEHKTKNVLTRQPRVSHGRIFNKWRNN